MIKDIISNARAVCTACGGVIKDRPKRCAVCNAAYCFKHEHNLTLVRKEGTEVMYACNNCITRDKLQVVDPNHPLYLANKG